MSCFDACAAGVVRWRWRSGIWITGGNTPIADSIMEGREGRLHVMKGV